jgi:hypothetical protein
MDLKNAAKYAFDLLSICVATPVCFYTILVIVGVGQYYTNQGESMLVSIIPLIVDAVYWKTFLTMSVIALSGIEVKRRAAHLLCCASERARRRR